MSTRAVTPTVAAPTAVVTPVQTPMLQRSCDCGQHTGGGECEECKKKKTLLQRYASGSGLFPISSSEAPPIVHEVLGSSGESLDPETRAFMEPRFRQDFSQVRVHTDPRAAESARSVGAQAYTVGRHLVFGAGRFAPATSQGRQLLAHELSHVVQQRNAGSCAIQQSLEIGSSDDPLEIEADQTAQRVTAGKEPGEPERRLSDAPARVQRATAAPGPAAAGPATPSPQAAMLLVEDDTKEIQAGQMRKAEFLDKLQAAVCGAADEELAAVGRTAKGCPYIERWIGHLRKKGSQFVERAIRKYAPDSAGVTSAEGYIPFVTARVRRGVARWAKTGEITEVPDELKGQLQVANVANAMDRLFSGVGGVVGAVGSAVAMGVRAVGGLLAKEREGRVRDADDPQAIQAQLGPGHALDGGIRSRMETAMGADFSGVRIHTDSTAASLSTRVNARAFTIGSDVAFGAGEYQPGTLIGDALIAHELAHVVQQGGATTAIAPMSSGAIEYQAFEEDADASAVRAVVSLWRGAGPTLKEIGKNAMPHLRSGLGLQRCGGTAPKAAADAAKKPTACKTASAGEWEASVNAVQAETDIEKKKAAQLGLLQQALCPLNATVQIAGNKHTDAVDPEDYAAYPVINFDIQLNAKQSWPRRGEMCKRTPRPPRLKEEDCATRLLSSNAGYNFRSRRVLYVVVGEKSLVTDTPAYTQRLVGHELYLAEKYTSTVESAQKHDGELDAWTRDFIGYFHLLGSKEGSRYSGFGWEPMLDMYYEGEDTSEDARKKAVQRLVDYYKNPTKSEPAAGRKQHPTEPEAVQELMLLWLRKMEKANPSRQLIKDLKAAGIRTP